ncbi:MAG: GAF domain-containing protein, partial [Bacteroidia bacterium]|nr:GAF domain-containing protein [Bacteroidia bacterium]
MIYAGKQTVVVFWKSSERLLLDQAKEYFLRNHPEVKLAIVSSTEEALQAAQDLAAEDARVGVIGADLQQIGFRGEFLFTKLREFFPNAQVVLQVQQNHPEKIIEAINTGLIDRVWEVKADLGSLIQVIEDAVGRFIQKIELSEKNRLLLELHRASLSLIGEVQFNKLISKLLRIVIENANAEVGYLLLEHLDTKLYIVAENRPEQFEANMLREEVSDDSPVCPAIVNFAKQTKDNVILHDALNEGFFMHHPYIRKHLCRSILCSPLVYQGKLIGLLYLENKSQTHAFSSFNIELLRLLSAPAAVSIQNAILYSEMEQLVAERTQQIIQQKNEIEHQRNELKKKNQDYIDSVTYARRIQEAFLPK